MATELTAEAVYEAVRGMEGEAWWPKGLSLFKTVASTWWRYPSDTGVNRGISPDGAADLLTAAMLGELAVKGEPGFPMVVGPCGHSETWTVALMRAGAGVECAEKHRGPTLLQAAAAAMRSVKGTT